MGLGVLVIATQPTREAGGSSTPITVGERRGDGAHSPVARVVGSAGGAPGHLADQPLQRRLDDDLDRLGLRDPAPPWPPAARGRRRARPPCRRGRGRPGTPRADRRCRAPPARPGSVRRRRRARRSRDFSGRPGGCSGKDRARQPAAPRPGAERAAERAPAERPPTTSGVRTRSVLAAATSASSRVGGGVATLRPATRQGCSRSTTLTPWRGSRSASAWRSRAPMPPPAPWLSSSVTNGFRARWVTSRASPCGVATRRSTPVTPWPPVRRPGRPRWAAARAARARCCGRC